MRNSGKIEEILQDLNSGRLPSMNHTRYILAEFSTSRGTMDDAKYCLTRYLESGWIPIIAHAERYCRTFTTVENIRTLRKMGCLVQANYYDLDEEHDEEIRTCTQSLVEAELVDMMGSDAHRIGHRPRSSCVVSGISGKTAGKSMQRIYFGGMRSGALSCKL